MPPGHGTRGWQIARQRVERIRRRAIQRLRGELNVDRLVAQGLEIGRGTFVARNAYLDPGHPWLITIGEDSGLSPGVIVMVHDASMKHHVGHTRIVTHRGGLATHGESMEAVEHCRPVEPEGTERSMW